MLWVFSCRTVICPWKPSRVSGHQGSIRNASFLIIEDLWQNRFQLTILGQFCGADQSGDSEAVSGADRKSSSASGQAAGAAAQTSWRSVGVVVVVAGWVLGQVAVDILHSLAVTLNGQRIVNVASGPDVAEKGYFQKYLNSQNLWLQAEEENSSFPSLLIYQLNPEGRNDKQWLKSAVVLK